tara:strand:+ start:3420 stop:3590 length:171 start_codon:yes stop_codon:yes gene_type:complete
MSETRFGKIVYCPPEKCYTNVHIEETAHGYKVFKERGDTRPLSFIPFSAVKQIEYR